MNRGRCSRSDGRLIAAGGIVHRPASAPFIPHPCPLPLAIAVPARKRTPRRLHVERLELRCLLATVQQVYFENFESGDGGYVADNTGGSVLGMWHYSIGRRADGLPNHSPDHNWYYGMFETSTGGGRYDVLPFDHQGTLKSPAIPLPSCGTSTLSFSYVLNTRPELDRDFAEVFVIDDSGATQILSRADGTLPQSGYDQWLTATADLSAFAGDDIMLLFSFRTGTPPLVDPEGWYVDDVLITNLCQAADLSVDKSVDDATPNEGQTITYTITAASAAGSAGDVSSVTVTDSLPAGVTFVSATLSEGSYDPLTDLWSGLELVPGESQTLIITATVNAGTAGQSLSNTATIAGSDDPNPGNDTDTVTVIVNSVDLSVLKDASDLTPNEGQTITYTISASNAASSNAAATNVVVTDNLPADVTFVSASASEGTYDSATDLWTGLQLQPGETATLAITVIVNAGTAGQSLQNVARIDGDETDPDGGNNEDGVTVIVNAVDLSVVKTASDPTPDEQQTLTYTIIASNSLASNAPATNVVVTDNLPPGVTFVSATADEGAYDPGADQWTGLELAQGETRTLAIAVTVNAGTGGQTLTNTAVVGGAETDPNLANNQSTASVTVNQRLADLSVSKTVDDTTPNEGQTITYTITASNAATSSAASNVAVQDSLPAGVTFVFATASEGTYDPNTDTWSGLNLAPGESQTLEIVVTVNAGTAGQVLFNTAAIGGPDVDPDDTDNEAEASAVVNSVVQFIAPLSVYRTAGPFVPPAPIVVSAPAAGQATIRGFKWHDLDQDGVWDAGEQARPGWRIYLDTSGDNVFDPQTEPFAVTATDGSFVFANVAPGTYTIREDRAGLSDGTFQVQRFPAADTSGQRDPDEHRVTVVAGQILAGNAGVAEEPNFGTFEYSPLIRPADEFPGRFFASAASDQQTYLAATEAWQSFSVSNTTDRPLRIDAINKIIDASAIAPAAQFVTIFQLAAGGTLAPVTLPIDVPAGTSVEFFAFYDPAVRTGGTVTEQYPDWSDETRPPHTFATNDRLEIVTTFTDATPESGPTFTARLIGASTFDSDISYDGLVENFDVARLSDLLAKQWPAVEGQPGSVFDPTSDINARLPNGAASTVNTTAWPVAGPPAREIGYGDFAPLNVEFDRGRAPLLDLDADNSSSVQGVDFRAEFTAGSARVADADARFANRSPLRLASVELSILNPRDGASEDFDFSNLPAGISGVSQFTGGTRILTLSGANSVEDYAQALKQISYKNADPTPTPGTRTIRIQATGGTDFPAGQTLGNVAFTEVLVKPAAAPAALPEGEPAGIAAAVPAGSICESSPPQHQPSSSGISALLAPLATEERAAPPGAQQSHSLADAIASLASAEAEPKPFGPLELEFWHLLLPFPSESESSGDVTGSPHEHPSSAPASPANEAPLAESASFVIFAELLAPECPHDTEARDLLFAQMAEDDLDLAPFAD